VYFGWAKISSSDEVYKAVLSIGYNPTFGNKEKSLEVYLVHDFGRDFYEDQLSLVICGYIRPMCKIPWGEIDSLRLTDKYRGPQDRDFKRRCVCSRCVGTTRIYFE